MTYAFDYKNVVRKFPGFQLGPINLNLEPGMVMGFIGPNGAGKTTSIQCLMGLLKADSGSVTIFGRENDPNKIDWKYDIGYVGDAHVFYENWSGLKNLNFVSRFYPNWSDKLAEELANRFDIQLNKKAKELSTGNRVKLSLIMALAHSPRLLVLDVPTSGLDPVIRTELLDVLFSVLENGERSIFYSTHIISDISRIADELAFISNGKIIRRSAKDDLLDEWRSVSFRFAGKLPDLPSIIQHQNEGPDHKLICSDHYAVTDILKRTGIENIQVNRMTLEEITVQILKGSKNG